MSLLINVITGGSVVEEVSNLGLRQPWELQCRAITDLASRVGGTPIRGYTTTYCILCVSNVLQSMGDWVAIGTD